MTIPPVKDVIWRAEGDEREKGGSNRKSICDKHRAEYIQNRPNKVRHGVIGHSTQQKAVWLLC